MTPRVRAAAVALLEALLAEGEDVPMPAKSETRIKRVVTEADKDRARQTLRRHGLALKR